MNFQNHNNKPHRKGLGRPRGGAESLLGRTGRLSGLSADGHSFERLATSGSSCSGGSSAASGVGAAGSGEAPGISGGGSLGRGSLHDPTDRLGFK